MKATEQYFPLPVIVLHKKESFAAQGGPEEMKATEYVFQSCTG